MFVGDVKIRSRGRGAKKFFMLINEDDEKETTTSVKEKAATLAADTCN